MVYCIRFYEHAHLHIPKWPVLACSTVQRIYKARRHFESSRTIVWPTATPPTTKRYTFLVALFLLRLPCALAPLSHRSLSALWVDLGQIPTKTWRRLLDLPGQLFLLQSRWKTIDARTKSKLNKVSHSHPAVGETPAAAPVKVEDD